MPASLATPSVPGWVLTPLVQKQIDDRAKASGKSVREEEIALLSEKQPMHSFTKPEGIGALAVFLCERRGRDHHRLGLFHRRRLGRAVISDILRCERAAPMKVRAP